MTKTAVAETISPQVTAVGNDVNAQAQRIARAMNWAFTQRPQTHLSISCGDAGWDDYPAITCGDAGNSLAVALANVIATGSVDTFFDTDIWVSPDDVTDLDVGVECDVTLAANTVTVTFTFTGGLGTAAATCACTQANNDAEITNSFDLSTVTNGGEWVRLQVACQRTAGAGTAHTVRNVRVNEIDGRSIPGDPEDN